MNSSFEALVKLRFCATLWNTFNRKSIIPHSFCSPKELIKNNICNHPLNFILPRLLNTPKIHTFATLNSTTETMNKTRKRTLKIALIVLLCIIALPVAAFLIVSWAILPPQKLTPLVVNMANEYLEADLQCEKIELTYLETFPYLGVALTDGKLVSHVAEDDSLARLEAEHHLPTDSLLSFSKCVVAVQPMDFLLRNRLTVKNLVLVRPSIYGYVNEKGKANWEIYNATDTMAVEDSTDTASLPYIDVQRVRIIDGTLTYDDRQSALFTHLDGFYFVGDGARTDTSAVLDIRTGWKAFQFQSPDYALENDLELNLKSRILLGDRRVTLSDTEMLVNKLPFTLNGSVFANGEKRCLDMDLAYGLNVPDLNTLLAFVPSAYMKRDKDTRITGAVKLTGTIRGELGDSVYPVVSACCLLENGSLQGKSEDSGIDSLSLDVDLLLDMAHSDSSFIDLSRMYMKGKHCAFDMKGRVTDLLDNPDIQASLNGDIDFTEISKNFLTSDTLVMEGAIKTNMETRFKMNDLLQSNYGKIFAQGEMDVENFRAISAPFDVSLTVTKARLRVDSETRAERFLKDQKLMSGSLTVDSMDIKWKDKIVTNLSRLDMALTAPFTTDTTAIIPMAGRVSFNRLRTLLPDSVWLWAGKTEVKGGIKPSPSNKKMPVAAGIVTSDSLAYLYPQYHSGILLTNSSFNMSAFPYKVDTMAFRNRRKERVALNRDSLRRQALAQRDTTLMLDRSTSRLLRKWDVKGSVVFNNMKAFSPFFPVKMEMQGSTVHFTTNDIKLTGARLQMGKSDFTLNGEINSLRRALLRGGKLTADLSVNSNYIDCNELMNAISRGMAYGDRQLAASSTDMASEGFEDFQASSMQLNNVADTTDTAGVFVLPKFLDLTLRTKAKKIDFNDISLENTSGGVVLHDQSLQLTNLNTRSNIGSGYLTMIYTAKDRTGAYAGFDLDMHDILVEKLISLFPSIDTLLPMLRSFEGIVDCQLAATCDMDSTMSVLLPSLYAACHLEGQDMVLLDGETFAEISKTLMFKNKERNQIDHIAVDFIVQDNKIEVFPFLIEMDRYRVAVGGTQNLDMSFNYHISVLKSPVPFKLGINITGNMDDFKFKIGKCKYKDLFKPAKSSVLDSTNVRINVRQDIYETIQKQLQASLFDKGFLLPDSIHLKEHRHIAENAVALPAGREEEEETEAER